jgi:predicted dehydrogenase
MEGVEINALADITPGNLAHAQVLVAEKQGKRPEGYGNGPEHFKELVLREDIDAVLATTPPNWHAPIAVAAMRAKKYAATEVPAAVSLEECWELVNTSEATGTPCMMLENVCNSRDTLMVLNMVRQGLLGELIHCEAGYQHDCRALCFDENGNFSEGKFASTTGGSHYQLWGTINSLRRNGNLYPTHSVGPIAQYLNINRGDRFSHLVSMSSKSRGLNLWVASKFGPNHPNARLAYAQGDVNTTLIRTENGCTVTLYYDIHSPRPYDLIFRVQGTEGIYLKTRDSIYVQGESKPDTWETIENYRQKYEHPLWNKLGGAAEKSGHGGGDYITLYQFIKAVRQRSQQPLQDVYDAATWSAIMPLSESSVARGGAPMDFPDFTRGKWNSRPPVPVVMD